VLVLSQGSGSESNSQSQLGSLEQDGAYKYSHLLQDVECRIQFSNLEFKYMIKYTTHKATKLQEAMGGKGAILCGWSD
jgi:hypothetical protein